MATSTATAVWNGDLPHGSGQITAGTGAFAVPYSLKSRIGEEAKSNPEELIGAAHAGCFSMMVSALCTNAGLVPTAIQTKASVTFGPVEGGFAITAIALSCEASIPGIDAAGFQELAENAKVNCPVSKALTGVPITLEARLIH